MGAGGARVPLVPDAAGLLASVVRVQGKAPSSEGRTMEMMLEKFVLGSQFSVFIAFKPHSRLGQ